MDSTIPFDAAKAEAFAGELVDIFNKSALGMMISLGHRTGLFDHMTGSVPASSHEIAEKSGLHERYVREWLGSMATGGIVDYDPKNKQYKLPDEYAAFLTRQSGPENFAVFAEFIFACAENGEEILDCFRNGGGISYDKFHRFYHAMDEDQSIIGTFLNHFLPSEPALVERLENGISVLDAGCGSGGLLLQLASKFPKSRFMGLDFSDYALQLARKNAHELGLGHLAFEVQNLTDFDKSAPEKEFDLILTIDAIHDQQKPKNVLKGIRKALKDEGLYVMVDINGTGHLELDRDNPLAPLIYAISCLHCVPASIGQGGEGLGAMWGEEKIREFLDECGFSHVGKKTFDSDPMNNWFVVSK